MTRNELFRAFVAASEQLHRLREEARRQGLADLAADALKAGQVVAAAIGRFNKPAVAS